MSPLTVVLILGFVALASAASIEPVGTEVPFVGWEGRIVGGSTAGANQFPHQASLRNTGNVHLCGGAIISNNRVVSVAHCTQPANRITRVRVGSNFRTTGGVYHGVILIKNHPNYNATTLANDISFLVTSTTITFNAATSSIALGPTIVSTVSAEISGWGLIALPGSAPVELQFALTQTLTLADCRSQHRPRNAIFVRDSNICTFSAGQGICFGDGGGPLISGGQLIGVASWGIACARGRPDVHARISSFRSFLLS